MAHTITVNLDRGELENIRAALYALEDKIYTRMGRKVPGASDQYEQNLILRKKVDGLFRQMDGEPRRTTRPQIHAGRVPDPAGNIAAPLGESGKRRNGPKHLFSTWK